MGVSHPKVRYLLNLLSVTFVSEYYLGLFHQTLPCTSTDIKAWFSFLFLTMYQFNIFQCINDPHFIVYQ